MGGGMPMSGGMAGGPNPNGAAGGPNSNGMSGGPMPSGMPGRGPMQTGPTPNGMPMVQQIQLPPEQKKDIAGIVKTVVIVILAILTVVFIGLFVWKFIEYDDLQAEWDTKTDLEVAQAEDNVRMEEAKKYEEMIKYPYETFTGPADYGELSFEYPKTWSVYLPDPATMGGEFHAYMNPVQVDTVGAGSTINALRVTITNQRYEDVVNSYVGAVADPGIDFNVQTMDVTNEKTGQTFTVNRYEGQIPGTELVGYMIVFKIRDKTVILQTDNSQVFGEEFNKLVNTIQFNA